MLTRILGRPVNRRRVQRIFRKIGYITPSRRKREILCSKVPDAKADRPNQVLEADLKLSKDHYHQKQNQKIRIQKRQDNSYVYKAYHSKEVEQEIIKRGYIPHIRYRREEKKIRKRHHAAKRWVVERTNSWHNRFRKLFTRYEKKEKRTILV